MDNALKKLIGSRAAIIGESPSKLLVDALLGNESKVANYFSVDPIVDESGLQQQHRMMKMALLMASLNMGLSTA
jgi:hypothetical protein